MPADSEHPVDVIAELVAENIKKHTHSEDGSAWCSSGHPDCMPYPNFSLHIEITTGGLRYLVENTDGTNCEITAEQYRDLVALLQCAQLDALREMARDFIQGEDGRAIGLADIVSRVWPEDDRP